MIVVAIIAVLFTLAVPCYQHILIDIYMKEAAQLALKNVQFMEKYYAINGKYTNQGSWPILPYQKSPQTGKVLYKLTLSPTVYSSANDMEYRVQAQPVCGTIVEDKGCVCIDQDNNLYLYQDKLCLNAPNKCNCITK